MSSKYFVAIRPRTNDFHSVHKEGCPFLGEDDKRVYLGLFNTDKAAEIESKKHFDKSKSCPYCSHEKKISYDIPSPEEVVFSIIHYAEPEKLNYYQNMFSCVN